MVLPVGASISPQAAYYRRMSPEQKAAQVERNRLRKARRSPDQVERDRLRALETEISWRAQNAERYRQLRKLADERRYSDPEKRRNLLLNKIKYRAKRDGREFNLTIDDIVIPENCPVLGIPLEFSINKGKKAQAAMNSPSVDRFDSSKGYVKGNIRIISNRANLLKGSATLEEISRIYAYMRGEL